jgi:hypothetical protein
MVGGRSSRISYLSALLRLSTAVLFVATGSAQTTQGVISGEVRDSISDQPIFNAKISFTHLDSGTTGGGLTADPGSFFLPLLSPGLYRLEVSADGYQPQEINNLSLDVGGKLSLDFRLRPLSDVWELKSRGSVVVRGSTEVRTFYGPDVNPNRIAILEPTLSQETKLDSSVSYVIDSQLLQTLPLLDRDVYSQLVLLPAVSAYTGTGRGVNVSVAGQRPSSSNFLLDGIENNNALITGPLAPVPPEAIQEYRISTNNYSAEYGGTGSFVANAITRGAGPSWHGNAFSYGQWKALNANEFLRNTFGQERLPEREIIPGGSVGGPVIAQRLFTELSFEARFHHGESDPQDFLLPTKSFVAGLVPGSAPAQLLSPYLIILPDAPGPSAMKSIAPPASFNQSSAVSRTDYTNLNGTQKLFLRIMASRFTEPSLLFNPYPGLSSDLLNNASSVAAGWTRLFSPSVAVETRVGVNGLRFSLDRPHAELPSIQSTDQVVLPGSAAAFGLTDKDRTFEFSQNVLLRWRNHFFKLGGGWLHRSIDSSVLAGLSGTYTFQDLGHLAISQPINLLLTYPRGNPDPAAAPDPNRSYAYSNFSLFLQDSYQVNRRLTLNYGLRYEFFGSPHNTGAVKDSILQLGTGANIEQRIAGASFKVGDTGDQTLYSSIQGNWAGRFALSLDPFGNSKSILRAGYGLFYERPFDNFWQTISNNSIQNGFSSFNGPVNFLSNPRQIAAANPPYLVEDYFEPVLFQPSLRSAQVQSFFADAEYYPAEGWAIELRGLGTLGRRLTTTDQVNRDFSVAPDFNTNANGDLINPNGKLNPNLATLLYRANQGKSDYLGGSAIVRHRGRLTEWQASYTWSHTIDNQSDPLAGAFSNFNFASTLTGNIPSTLASFTRQFDSQGDRGSADFDQRHNLVFYFSGQTPGWGSPLLRRFSEKLQFGVLGAIRSGFPFSAPALSDFDSHVAELQNNRADLITSPSEATVTSSIAGGRQLLNPAAFATPAPGMVGNTGRNAFEGPGLFNFDLSVSREFSVPPCSERCRIIIRADAFNVLNHANLNNPFPYFVGTPGFGAASYGRAESGNGFPLEQPLSETARHLQLMVRVRF